MTHTCDRTPALCDEQRHGPRSWSPTYNRIATIVVVSMLSLATSRAYTTPIVLAHSETADAGDVIYLQGAGFGSGFVQYSHNDANWTSLTPATVSDKYLTLRLPGADTRLPDLLTIRVSPDNVTWSKPVYINQSRVTSFDTSAVAPNGQFRLFGRNLTLGRVPTVQLVDSADGRVSFAAVNFNTAQSYVLQVTAPPSITPGHTYKVLVSNGFVGNGATGDLVQAPQQLLGRAGGVDYWNLGTSWASDLDFFSNVYNVASDPRLSLHSSGSGTGDDTAPLENAVAVASRAGGGVILLPAGTYNLNFSNGCGLTLYPRVVVMGAGIASTTIKYGFGTPPPLNTGGYAVCFQNQTGISDLTLKNVDTSGLWPQSGLAINVDEMFIQHVDWEIGTAQWLILRDTSRMALENSTLSQGVDAYNFNGVLAIPGCRECEISSNTINFAVGGMLFDNTSDTIFEHNYVVRVVSRSPPPVSVTHSIAANFATNLSIINNSFSSVGTGQPTNNDGEAIETEGGGPVRHDEFRGTVSAGSPNTITDSAQNFFQSSNGLSSLQPLATLAIVSGMGMGQRRKVIAISADGHSLTTDQPWDIQPTAGSHYATFDWSAQHWIVANNEMTGNFKGIEMFNASANDVLIESNVLLDSGGIMISPDQASPGLFNLISQIDIVGNTLTDASGLRPSYIGIIPREDQQTQAFGTAVLGLSVRANSVVGYRPNVVVSNPSWDDYKVVSEGFLCYWAWQSLDGFVDVGQPHTILGAIFQGNLARNSDAPFVLGTSASQTTISDTINLSPGTRTLEIQLPGASQSSDNTSIQGSLSEISINHASSNTQLVNTTVSSNSSRTILIAEQATATIDNLAMVGDTMTGDTDMIVFATVTSNPLSLVTAGLMIRGSPSTGSPFILIGVNSSAQLVMESRAVLGEKPQTLILPTPSTSAWLRLTKIGSTVSSSYSLDGSQWTPIGWQKLSLTSEVFCAGITSLAGSAGHSSPVTFSNFMMH